MIKNILNYTKNLICFAVSSLLLLSTSFGIDNNTTYNFSTYQPNAMSNANSLYYAGYSLHDIAHNIYDYYKNGANELTYLTMIDALESANLNIVIFNVNGANNPIYEAYILDNTLDLVYLCDSNDSKMYFGGITTDSTTLTSSKNVTFTALNNLTGNVTYQNRSLDSNKLVSMKLNISYIYELCYSSTSIYELNGVWTSCSWNGDYYYQATPPEPSYIPTNEEIADKVQEFYNSDFFQNQSDFKDFFVVYNYNTGLFQFIGHNLGISIGQEIYPANYPTNTTGFDYWNFYIRSLGSIIWNWFNNYYWLYTTTLDSDTIVYNGKGTMTDLLELKFNPTYSTIIYSTTDYNCVVYSWDDEHGIDYEQEIIPGDYYTYNENVNPTTSEYNPISSYINVNSIDTLVSNADTVSLFELFVVPDFSNMEWVLLAIGVFWGYFGGFVLLMCVLLFILWIIRG